jgi:hypothetical protein
MGNVAPIVRALPFSSERPGGPITLDQVEAPVVRAGIGYWKRLCGQRKFPARTEVTPRDILGLLRNTILLRVVDDGADYEYRIVGDAHVIAHGFSAQGMRLSDLGAIAGGYEKVLKSLYDMPVRTSSPFAVRGWLARGEDEFIYSETVLLPLGPDETTVDHVLNFSVYVPHPAKAVLSA